MKCLPVSTLFDLVPAKPPFILGASPKVVFDSGKVLRNDVLGACVGQTQVVLTAGAERCSRNGGHMNMFKQRPSELHRLSVEIIGCEAVECALRLPAVKGLRSGEHVEHLRPSPPVSVEHFSNSSLRFLRPQCCYCTCLGEGGDAARRSRLTEDRRPVSTPTRQSPGLRSCRKPPLWDCTGS